MPLVMKVNRSVIYMISNNKFSILINLYAAVAVLEEKFIVIFSPLQVDGIIKTIKQKVSVPKLTCFIAC